MSYTDRSRHLASCIAICLLVLARTLFALGEDARERAHRFDSLIESLNAASERRLATVEALHNELRGPYAREVRALLYEALSRSNPLIVQGVVEVLARYGDVEDVPVMEAVLATSASIEVKTLTARLLPAFALGGNERARGQYIAYAEGFERAVPAAVMQALRRPPLTRRGQFDHDRDRLIRQVIKILTVQFDPIGAAVAYLDNPVYGPAAQNAVRHYIGNALGRDAGSWGRVWTAQGRDIENLVMEEVTELHLALLASLADLGAESDSELLAVFSRILGTGEQVIRQSLYETLEAMCRHGFALFDSLSGLDFTGAAGAEAMLWRDRVFMSVASTAAFTAESAAEAMLQRRGDFTAAASALGAALSLPPDLADPGGTFKTLMDAGVSQLEFMFMLPDLGLAERAAIAGALGSIGTSQSVSALVDILYSPYTQPSAGRDGLLTAEAVLDALRAAAVSDREGRDEARRILLRFLGDERVFPSPRADAPPVGIGHLVLWRLQRLARSTDTSMAAAQWAERLGWSLDREGTDD